MGKEAHLRKENLMAAYADKRDEVEVEKLRAEISKLMSETAQINQNMKYRMWVLGAAYVGAMGVLLRFIP